MKIQLHVGTKALIWDISGLWNRSHGRDYREKRIVISRFLVLYTVRTVWWNLLPSKSKVKYWYLYLLCSQQNLCDPLQVSYFMRQFKMQFFDIMHKYIRKSCYSKLLIHMHYALLSWRLQLQLQSISWLSNSFKQKIELKISDYF